MKLLTGFLMAWGNFLVLPCPVKRWDNDLKNHMLGFLPTIGFILGGLWAGLCIFLVWLGTPFFILAFLLSFLLPALCGFLHFDGFMDCNDAIFSRKSLEEKQHIMKDSSCGAFAVVGAVFMILAYFCFIATALGTGIDFIDLWLIPVVSRSFAGINVLLSKPIDHSQYAEGKGSSDSGQKKKSVLAIILQLILFCAIGLFVAVDITATLTVIGATALVSLISIALAKRSLGGMGGDIAGFGIVWGELAGIFAMFLL